jgi:heat shock protein 4
MSVVGLDLGLLNSVIAAAGRGGVDVILNGNSNRLNPSMVTFDESRKMGEQVAGSTSISKFKTTIKNMKRLVGLAFDDPRAQKEMKRVPYQCVPITHASGGPPSIAVKVPSDGNDTILPIEQVLGMMVHHMGMIAAKKASEASAGNIADVAALFPQDWVIAIPPYYTDAQRRAVLNGCKIVGIPGVQRLMHENTATALAYGIFKDIRKEFTKENPTNVMFIDMGASAYTVTIAAFEPGKLTVKSCQYDDSLGGRDFDDVIGNWVAAKFVEKYGKKLSSAPQDKPKVMLKILAAAEKAKKTLSPQGVKEASINLECLMDDLDFNIMLKAAEYEEMSAPLVARLEEPIQKCLAESKLTAADLSSVEIVGGSTRIGFLKKKLLSILGVETLSTTMNADESVSRGAALQSAILSPRFKVLPYEIVEYGPLPIKLAWEEDKDPVAPADGEEMPTNSVVMFGRGLNFPIVRRVTLRRDGEFNVSCTYDPSAADYGLDSGATQDISSWSVKAPAGEEKKIRVNVKQDIHGIVQMSSAQMVEEIEEEEPAKEDEAKAGEEGEAAAAEKKKKVKRTNLEYTETKPLEWTEAEINKFSETETAMRSTDRIVQETSDMRNELESYIYDMRDKITMDSSLGAYATQAEKDEFVKKNEDAENWLYEDGFDAKKDVLAQKLGELKKLGDPVERRAVEAEARPVAIASLQKNVEKYKKWLADAQASDDFAHITEEEFSTCHKKCDEVSNWLYEMLDKQGSLPQNVDPAFTTAEVTSKNKGLSNVCSPIVHKPKPKPKPEAPKEEPKPEADAPAKEEPIPMETDEAEKKEDKMEVEVDEA